MVYTRPSSVINLLQARTKATIRTNNWGQSFDQRNLPMERFDYKLEMYPQSSHIYQLAVVGLDALHV